DGPAPAVCRPGPLFRHGKRAGGGDAAMNRIDAITLIIFVSVILVGLSVLVFMDMWRKRPSNLLRQRLHSVSGRGGSESRERLLQNLQRAQIEARRRKRREAMGGLGYHLNRLD